MAMSHCNEEAFHTPVQPGSVAQMILCQLTARVTKHGKDPYRQFAWHESLLDGTRTLVVITAYRMSQHRTKERCDPTMSIMQQWRNLRKQAIDNPIPRQQMLNDLATFTKPRVQAGHEIIIMMDANADPIDSRPMDEFMDALALWDLITDFLPATPPTTT
jgi:hypothetical protein